MQTTYEGKLFEPWEEIASRGTVRDCHDNEVDFEAATALMDKELCEEIHLEGERTDQQFFDEYAKRHTEKFDGEQFAPYYGLAW